MQTYDSWFQARVQRAMADTRAPLSEAQWQVIRAAKQAEQEQLAFNSSITTKREMRFTAAPTRLEI